MTTIAKMSRLNSINETSVITSSDATKKEQNKSTDLLGFLSNEKRLKPFSLDLFLAKPRQS